MVSAVGALAVAVIDPHFSLVPTWPSHGWLLALAIVSQILGWLLIVNALASLPPLETSILLLVQPVFAIVWSRLIFDEHMSPLQWAGTLLVLIGVATVSSGRTTENVGTRRRTA